MCLSACNDSVRFSFGFCFCYFLLALILCVCGGGLYFILYKLFLAGGIMNCLSVTIQPEKLAACSAVLLLMCFCFLILVLDVRVQSEHAQKILVGNEQCV